MFNNPSYDPWLASKGITIGKPEDWVDIVYTSTDSAGKVETVKTKMYLPLDE